MAMTRKGVLTIGLVAVVVAVFGGKYAMTNLIPPPASMTPVVPDKINIPAASVGTQEKSYGVIPAPTKIEATGDCVKVLVIPWNAIAPLSYANGGASTAPNSIVRKYNGGCYVIERQDDSAVMRAEQIKFAQSRHTDGAALVIIMGDGYPAYLDALKPNMDKLGEAVKAVAITGFSYGEDGCMLPASVKSDPQKMKGMSVFAVPVDGDWNICIKLASDNAVRVNTDNKVYDPDALNFISTDTFVQADEKFIAHACETRVISHNGLQTHETKQVCGDGVATWTPGDVTVVEKNTTPPGVIKVASTREYSQQMPALLIGNDAWMKQNRAKIVGLIKALDQAAQEIRNDQSALMRVGAYHAQIFGEQNAAYWAKYFTGVVQRDNFGNDVFLGGSRVVGLADEASQFGLLPGSYNVFQGVYRTFAAIDMKFYPSIVKAVPPYAEAVDTSYIQEALRDLPSVEAPKAQFTENKPITTVVSKRVISVEFDTGRATLRPASVQSLSDFADQSAFTSLEIAVNGYTDNTGPADVNTKLSAARAAAVADWLTSTAPKTFPESRLRVRGYGPSNPVADNATDLGRQQNRRVEVVLGN